MCEKHKEEKRERNKKNNHTSQKCAACVFVGLLKRRCLVFHLRPRQSVCAGEKEYKLRTAAIYRSPFKELCVIMRSIVIAVVHLERDASMNWLRTNQFTRVLLLSGR